MSLMKKVSSPQKMECVVKNYNQRNLRKREKEKQTQLMIMKTNLK